MGKDELIVIVPAAGAGKRLGLGINKAFAMLNGAPLLVHCLHMLEATGMVKRAVVVLAPLEVAEGHELLAGYQKDYFPTLPFCVAAGGKERQDSVANALAAVEETDCYIAVHDGARPFAGRAVFERTLAAAKVHGAAIAAVPVKDTIKVDSPSLSHFDCIVLTSIVDDQIFDLVNSIQLLWKVIQCDL